MKTIMDLEIKKADRPIKVMQFGEGNFLRAFADYFIDILNEKTEFDGDIAIVKPIPFGNLDNFKKQDNLYTVVLRGRKEGKVINEPRVVTSVSKVIDAKDDFDEYMALAHLDTLRFVISNTTEAGITLKEDDHFDGLPESYPGKLTKFLFERFTFFKGDKTKGLIMLPVELIDYNGRELKRCVLALADIWNLGDEFKNWLENANVFCSTLVDRIVTGYPRGEVDKICEELGYTDNLVDVGEPFGLWVIESDKDISAELPFAKANLPVIFTDNVKPYKDRKVRVLNGAHTASVLVSYLGGINIVRDMMHDEIFGKMTRQIVDTEIVPLVPLPIEDVKDFANSVYERFDNPFINHELLSISLNSVSKWKARVLPSFKDNYNKNGKLPKLLTFSFAGLLAFYCSSDLREDGLHSKRNNGTEYTVHDNPDVLKIFAENSKKAEEDYVKVIASNIDFWGEDLTKYNNFVKDVTNYLIKIKQNPACAVKYILDD